MREENNELKQPDHFYSCFASSSAHNKIEIDDHSQTVTVVMSSEKTKKEI